VLPLPLPTILPAFVRMSRISSSDSVPRVHMRLPRLGLLAKSANIFCGDLSEFSTRSSRSLL